MDIAKGDHEIADLIVVARDNNSSILFVKSHRYPAPLYTIDSAIPDDPRLHLTVNDKIIVRVYCSNSEPSNGLEITINGIPNFEELTKETFEKYFTISKL